MPEQGSKKDVYVGLALIGTLGLMVMPLSPGMLDLFLTLSLASAVYVFFLTVNVRNPMEFSTFPTVLLITTLFRLALNVATTRLILSHGSEGEAAAGRVVRAIAELVLGGNYVIGLIVFAILITINFVVITKGAGRIAEVSARFTLDSLPGKQMSIDAELNAGHINEKQAKARRAALEKEMDFYGAMDGASKFVRGDAIAALIITGVNILGGLLIGVLQQGMDLARAAEVYTVLTVGDGLVSQIPALIISTGAGVLSTRSSTGNGLSNALSGEMLASARPLYMAGGLFLFLGVLPGMPLLSYGLIGGGLILLARKVSAMPPKVLEDDKPVAPVVPKNEVEDSLALPLLEFEVGFELVPLVDSDKGGELLKKINSLRKQFAQDLGVVIPSIAVRDNLALQPGEYRLMLSGNELGRADVRAGRYMAMNPSGPLAIAGEPTKEPAFGIEARWIMPADKERAERLGYTVVDAATVVATHLSELLRTHAHEMLGRKEAQQLFDLFARDNSKTIEELIPGVLPAAEVTRILRKLLKEGVSIRDLRTILEGLLECAPQTKDPEQLVEMIRQRLGRSLSSRFKAQDGGLYALFLDPQVEDIFRQMQRGVAPSNPSDLQRIMKAMENAIVGMSETRYAPLFVTAPDIRRSVYTFVSRYFPGVPVLSLREIDARTSVTSLGVVGLSTALAA